MLRIYGHPFAAFYWKVLIALYERDVPFGFGVVELPEGLRVITRLTEADPSRLVFAQPMQLDVVPLHVDDNGRTVVTYAFAPGAP